MGCPLSVKVASRTLQNLLDAPPLPPRKVFPMGLLSNLRVLAGSDIGDTVREILRRVRLVEQRMDDDAELSEARYRRLNKRRRDAERDAEPSGEESGTQAPSSTGNPRIDRLRARRSRRMRIIGGADE